MTVNHEILKGRDFSPEFVFNTSRSSGPGGQSVNKVSSKVELRFDVQASLLLSDAERELLSEKLANKINQDGILSITSQSERTQLKNKGVVIDRFYRLLYKALTPVKPRKKTKPSLAVREKRLELKRKIAEKKDLRRKDVRT
jgi:ribosome-associated protein